jgi:hypothetical protein
LQDLEKPDDARLSEASDSFSLGEKFIGDCPQTQFFSGAVAASLVIRLSTSARPELLWRTIFFADTAL